MQGQSRQMLQEKIGFCFNDETLLVEALVHRSYANEHPGGCRDNERLEFLGDAILNLLIAEELFRRCPSFSEGELTRRRAEIVNAAALAHLARSICLGAALLLGRGEEKTGGRDKENILADSLEALFGAVYCDAGLDGVRRVILDIFSPLIAEAVTQRFDSDFKTRLQERLQARRQPSPVYRFVDISGPDHDRRFTAEIYSGERCLGLGSGRSKKEAEQAAARCALSRLAD